MDGAWQKILDEAVVIDGAVSQAEMFPAESALTLPHQHSTEAQKGSCSESIHASTGTTHRRA
jgi:hypothetical protein